MNYSVSFITKSLLCIANVLTIENRDRSGDLQPSPFSPAWMFPVVPISPAGGVTVVPGVVPMSPAGGVTVVPGVGFLEQ